MLKVIIADDENKARNAIIMMGEWDKLGLEFEQVSNGLALVESVKRQRPDIVVTDLHMPGLGEARLLQALREIDEHLQIIVISGYDEFDYMKQAIVIQAVDYLLKPFSREQLNLVLNKAIQAVKVTQQQRLQKHLAVQHFREDMLTRLLEGRSIDADHYFQLTGKVLRSDQFYTIAICKIANFTQSMNRFGNDEQLLFFSVNNIVDEVLDSQEIVFMHHAKDKEMRILIQMDDSHIGNLKRACLNCIDKLYSLLKIKIFMGIGEAYIGLSNVKQSYQEAHLALQRSYFNVAGDVAVFRELQLTGSQEKLSQAQQRELEVLRAAVQHDNIAYVREWVERWHAEQALCSKLNTSHISLIIIAIWRELEQLVIPLHIEDQALSLKKMEPIRQQLQIEFDLNTVKDIFLSFISEYELPHKSKPALHNGVIYEIRNYMEQHLYDKISLQDLADRFYLSKESISKLYKKTFGINLFDHLTELKMEQAKQMLMNEQIKVREIVSQLGFTDESHFSKTFKKHTGLSPRAYRNRLDKSI